MSAFNTVVSERWWAERDTVKGVWLRERAMMDLRYWNNHIHHVNKTATFPRVEGDSLRSTSVEALVIDFSFSSEETGQGVSCGS